MNGEMTIPPHRDLPPGRLEARRRHLLAEIRRPPASSRRRLLVVAAGTAALVAAIAVPLGVRGAPKPHTEIVYRPVRVIVVSRRPVTQSLDLASAARRKPHTLLERFVVGLAAEGRHVKPEPHAQAGVTRAAAINAMSPTFRKASGAWLVRLRTNGRWRLVWLLAIRHGCVPSYGPVGGSYRTMWAGFVDAHTGRPLYQITVGDGKARPC